MDKSTIGILISCVLVFTLIFAFGNKNAAQYVEPTEEVVETNVLSTEKYVSTTNNPEKEFTIETDLLKVVFSTKGASISSMMVKNHANADGTLADIVFKGEKDPNAFLMYWGDDTTNPILDNFDYVIEGKKVTFTNTYKQEDGKTFTVTKVFEFKDGEYLFALDTDITGDFTGEDYAYTIAYEPQVGPNFTQMKNNNYDYRRFYAGVEKKNGKVKRNSVRLTGDSFNSTKAFDWFSLTSKYFTVIARPANLDINYKYQAKQTTTGDIAQVNGFYLSTPKANAKDTNRIYFYCGPQLKKSLGSYYNGVDNAWGLKNYNLEDAMESGSILGWLEVALKWCLKILYKIVKNYGVAIILLTIILKLILWPLQKKSSESTAKMSALTPEIEAIKAKYPENPQKQNMEMSKLYQEKGIKPLGGCLPLLIQFPILIAFYGLLNRHIELRGAMFIPGWIPDLSLPDLVATLGFRIPLLGNELHLLPIIYTASMIFSMKFTQTQNTAGTQANQKATMWFMTWGMPIMFFFILYNAPSGLLLYWTTQNGLTILQQIITNKKMANGKLSMKKVEEKVEPEAVRKYQEKLKKLEMMKAEAEKAKAKAEKKNK